MTTIEYFSVSYAPGRYFDCAAQRCRISIDSCAAQYRRMKGSGSACSGCRIGASHAGELIPAVSSRQCCRCGGTDKRIVLGQICVSCYNRQGEFLSGRNAKGQRPIHARPVRAAYVFVAGDGYRHIKHVADVAEAVLAVLVRNPAASVRPVFAPAVNAEFCSLGGGI